MNFRRNVACDVGFEQPTRQFSQSPNARQARLEDHDRIAALQIRNGVSAKSYQDWVRLWQSNPTYKLLGGAWPIGWVLESDSGEIVGWVGNIPSAYQFRGRTLRAVTPHSWVVDESHRGHGIPILNRLMGQPQVDLFVCTGVSARSERFSRYLRLSRVPMGAWDKSAFWITNHQGFAEVALRMKSFPVARITSYPVSAALSCWWWRKDRQVRPHRSSSEIELCSDFDQRFDVFWDELQHQNENVLLAVRTREMLAWHFCDALQRQRAWILTTSKGSRLTTYAIFDRQDNPAIGLRRVRLVDFQAQTGYEENLMSAISWMLHKCRQEATHILEVNGCWLNRPGLPRVRAPYHRTMPSWSYYYKTDDRGLTTALRDPEVWAPSSFDGDLSL